MRQAGVTGFCQGGSLALLAAEYADVDAAAPFYGIPNSYPSHVRRYAHIMDSQNHTCDKYGCLRISAQNFYHKAMLGSSSCQTVLAMCQQET